MRSFTIVPLFAVALVCGVARIDAQRLAEPTLGIPSSRPLALGAKTAEQSRAPLVNSTLISRSSSVGRGALIGAGSGAVVGALWGEYVDRHQSCPLGGCGRSNAGPYAVVGAVVGGVLGAAIGWFARDRRTPSSATSRELPNECCS